MSETKSPVALVTGASGGIGGAIARALAADGFIVAVHYRSGADKARSVIDEITQAGGRAEGFAADLMDKGAPEALIDSVAARFGRIDVLVNNAGGYRRFDHFNDLDDEEWDYAMSLNAKVPLWLARAAWGWLEAAPAGGRVINISSNGVKYPSPYAMHYKAAKAAVESITLSLAKAGAAKGVLVNAVRPGVIVTGMQQGIAGYDDEKLNARLKLIPMGRGGTPEEVAGMVAFLAGPKGSYITAQTFAVAGGE
jgi:3-oxoacyl-[acyl-carrier protein] reductase